MRADWSRGLFLTIFRLPTGLKHNMTHPLDLIIKTKLEVNARQIRTHLTWNQQNQKGNMTVAELC